MGLFDFIKDAGAKLLGIGEAKAATPVTAEALKKAVEDMGLKADGLNVAVDGDKVTVSGKATTPEEAEKIVLAVGNTVGVAKVDSQLTTAAAGAAAIMYTVKKGDTLWKIAETHYGKGKGDKYKEIVKANTPPVKNPDLIQPGWVLRIPPL
ncbi:nucleoid-associated protein YgaU [Rhodoligotrophos appendicifer]|uniref:peptidoglycan-binding protein LysM n=1 Tax=Rhodoligotrophos appendicifer TaxID=987056 RepID=UPI00117F5CB1|nr:peptidoglycan-binding protein LysM [Rhodoligotrophos appendicifer]